MIRQYDTAYFMASVDTLEDDRAFAEKEHADFPLLADPRKETAQAYGVLGRLGFANRWTFYIDPDGRIARVDKSVRPASSGQDIVATLAHLNVPRRR